MNKERLLNVFENKYEVGSNDGIQLENIIKNFPYFQAARVCHLKSLQAIKSFRFNEALKTTAAYTYDRNLLFDFVTDNKTGHNGDDVQVLQTTNQKEDTANKLEDKKETDIRAKKTETKKEKGSKMDEMLQFNKTDMMSFNQWLQLSNTHPQPKKEKETKIESTLEQKIDLINQFIEKSPSISKVDKNDTKPQKKHKLKDYQKELMTETLAKVYLAQKKYENAIEAYEILILKYPEKSAYFADQIKKIKSLKTN